jgi:hypothetical protein
MLDSATAGALIPRSLLNPAAAITATGVSPSGSWIDTQDLDGYLAFTAIFGAVGSTSVAVKLQEALDANGGTPTDVAGGGFTTVLAAGSPAVQTIVVPKTAFTKRYVGVSFTVVGAGNNFLSCVAHGSKKIS